MASVSDKTLKISVIVAALIIAVSAIGVGLAYTASTTNSGNSSTVTYSLLSFEDSKGNTVSASELTSKLSSYTADGMPADGSEYRISADGLMLRYRDTTDTSPSSTDADVKDLVYMVIAELSGTEFSCLKDAAVILRIGGSVSTSYVGVSAGQGSCQLIGNTFVATAVENTTFSCEYLGSVSLSIIPFTDVSGSDIASMIGKIVPTLTVYHSKSAVDSSVSTGRLSVGAIRCAEKSVVDGTYQTDDASLTYNTGLSTGYTIGLLRISGTLTGDWADEFVTITISNSFTGSSTAVTAKISDTSQLDVYIPLKITNGSFTGTIQMLFNGESTDEYPDNSSITFSLYETNEKEAGL